MPVVMIANSEKMKVKKSYPILVSTPIQFFRNFILPWGVGGGELMCFHLKVYAILFNSFCVFLLEHVNVFWIFLLLLAIKGTTIIQNKTEDRQSATSSNWARLTNPWKLFKPNKITRQLSFWEFKINNWLSTLI